ncbi:MAG: hypothetical protein K940chlam3_00876, partial [Chlamydiae bacterium]|nr:hypothetical protein [Chlamydiota bacterium]
EILIMIFSLCPLEDFQSNPLVCRLWHDLCHEYSLVAKKCEQLILSFPKKFKNVDAEQLKLLKSCQQYVSKLDLTPLSFEKSAYRLADTVAPYFRNLKEVNLPKFDFESFENLSQNERIETTNVQNLRSIGQLEWLFIESDQTQKTVFKELSSSLHLNTLSLYGTHLTPRNLQDISQIPSLVFLIFANQEFHIGHIKSLSSMKNLKKLAFYDCRFSLNAAKELSQMTHLTSLIFEDLHQRIQLVRSYKLLSQFIHLKILKVTGPARIRPEVIDTVLCMPHLSKLELQVYHSCDERINRVKQQYFEKYSRELNVELFY